MATLKTLVEIETMAEGGRRLARVIAALSQTVKPGLTTDFLDELSFKLIRAAEAEPAFLGYRPEGAKKPYSKTLCVSINEIVVHGLPSQYRLKEGDLVKLDLGLKFQGFYLDSAVTLGVGRISALAEKLIQTTKRSLKLAIREACPGRALRSIGSTIENCVRNNHFSVIRSLTGHGIGRALHEEPNVLNFGRPDQGLILAPGMVLAIEPMISLSDLSQGCKIKERPDGSFATFDDSLSAHFEHTVAVTEAGPRVLTEL